MDELLTPKQVARAIGVSESSLKRWCDQGRLPMIRTPGGHRRLPISGVMDFLRNHDRPLVEPEVLGLPATAGKSERTLEASRQELEAGLVNGDVNRCRQLIYDLYLAKYELSDLADQLLVPVFHEIGAGWECGEIDVYHERRSCEIVVRIMHDLRSVLAVPTKPAPVAMGGTPEGDPYVLPTHLIELVARENGWDATSLGSNIPLTSLCRAVEEHRPRVFWVSVSGVEDPQKFVEEFACLCDTAERCQTSLVIGGRALTKEIRDQIGTAVYCENLRQFKSFLRSLYRPLSANASRSSQSAN
ncbi:MerR family DNA-binding transcriptional regulator [Planctomycetales bacterium 10988]|nr:MerR family DNA-binding transcriptional regulator [Planctomycetales bacterium 10988]